VHLSRGEDDDSGKQKKKSRRRRRTDGARHYFSNADENICVKIKKKPVNQTKLVQILWSIPE
jgi:hypothetical protein